MTNARFHLSAYRWKLLAAAISVVAVMAFTPAGASATGGSYGGSSGSGCGSTTECPNSTVTKYYKNYCDVSVSPTDQTVSDPAGATGEFTVSVKKNTTGASSESGAYRDCDEGPGKTTVAAGVEVKWEITSGVCAGKSGSGTTDADGKFKFTVTGCGECGTANVKVSVKKVITATTTKTTSTTKKVCALYYGSLCIKWSYDCDTTVTTTTTVIKTIWVTVATCIKIEWKNCPPPPTGPTGEPTPPTGPTGDPTPPTGPTSDPTPPTGPTSEPTPPTGPTSNPPGPTVGATVVPPPAVAGLAVNKNCTKPYLLITASGKNGTPVSMTIYVDGKRWARVTKTPLNYKLFTSKLTAGKHTIKAVVRFADGTSSTATKKFRPCARFSATGRRSPAFTGTN
ncbi:MAG: hypothetical protein HY827_09500 [Actinobacteria bacterium]|nr:hypothetical protein [Actinomycetota bacterium]